MNLYNSSSQWGSIIDEIENYSGSYEFLVGDYVEDSFSYQYVFIGTVEYNGSTFVVVQEGSQSTYVYGAVADPGAFVAPATLPPINVNPFNIPSVQAPPVATQHAIARPLEYIASYADLRLAFGTDATAGREHFIEHGLAEGRSVSFDGLDYIASYTDLIAAFGADRDAGARHFITNGVKEGRLPDIFDGARYLANYADLRAAFDTDTDAAAAHFITFGYAEGRTDAIWSG